MSDIFFTIITVCYNAENQIEKTINSVLNQSFKNYEYIIKDGKSTDKTLSIVNAFGQKDKRIKIISNEDSGIYDAMNQAVDLAKGIYVYFLNAGDCLHDNNVLERVDDYAKKLKKDVLYGNIIQQITSSPIIREYKKVCSSKYYFLSGDCICHQAIFARRELFIDRKFDLNYKVCADKEWQLYLIEEKKEEFGRMPFIIADFLTEGYSKDNVNILEDETKKCLKRYCPYTIWVYYLISMLKKNDIFVKILRKIGKAFFFRRPTMKSQL